MSRFVSNDLEPCEEVPKQENTVPVCGCSRGDTSPRHHRTKNCVSRFIFPAAQLAAARRATWHTCVKVPPQLKFVISLPPSTWFGRRGAPETHSAKSARNSYVIEVFRRAAEVCHGCFFGILQSVTEAFFLFRVLCAKPA